MIHGVETTTEVATEAPEAVSTISDGKDDDDNSFKFWTTHARPRSFVTLFALAISILDSHRKGRRHAVRTCSSSLLCMLEIL